MAKKHAARNATIWALITALLNPAVMIPSAFGRDTDIFMGQATVTNTAEPNILVVLDTSDSMNTYEGWREYEGAYDSHIEYLWNDPAYIATISTAAPNSDFSNVGSSPNGYFVSWSGTCPNTLAGNPACPRDSGWFAGATDAIRTTMKTDATNYANGTESGDPGARSIYRNYFDASWVYWLPTGVAETDSKLWSNTFNRFVGGIRVSNFSSTNGTTDPVVRGGFNYGNNNNRTVGTSLHTPSSAVNRCTASLNAIMPSTVYAPTEHPRNEGKWLNQQWMRWEQWLNLENSRVSAYPGSHAQVNLGGNIRQGAIGTGYTGAAPGPNDNLAVGSGAGTVWSSAIPPTITAARDFGSNSGVVGTDGQPIRIRLDTGTAGSPDQTTDTYAGWTTLKADLGGYIFQSTVSGMAQAPLQALRGVYGYTLLTVAGGGAGAQENERFSAWLGNRDAATAPAFGAMTGTPAYFNFRNSPDRSVTSGATSTSCTTPCDPAAGVTRFSNDIAGNDATNTARPYFTRSGATYCVQNGTPTGDCTTSGGTITPGACNQPSAGTYTTAAIRTASSGTGCAWTGRQSRYIEGVGTVFYGGTCSGSCYGAGFVLGAASCSSGATSANYCDPATSGSSTANGGGSNWLGSYTIDGTTYNNATKNVLGQCSDKSDTTVTCDARIGNCVYNTAASTSALCPDRVVSNSTGGSTTNYPVYNRTAELNLNHDCKADEASSNGGSNVFMTSAKRALSTTFSNNSTNATSGPYSTNSGNAITASSAIDLYSVNYLNWKYGPKVNGNPIGRKTRLQIAKDALVALVNTTDGVRFGLETFNALPNDISLRSTQGSQGGKIVFPVKRMGSNAADTDFANRATLATVINNQLAKAATPLTESMYEAYLYYSGRAPRFGTSSAITANFTAAALPAVGGGNVTDGADATAVSGGNYVSPIMRNPTSAAPSSCQKNYIILLTDGGPEKDVDANNQIMPLRYTKGVNTFAPDTRVDTTQTDTASGQFETGTPALPSGPASIADTTRPDGGYVWLDELTYFMANADMSPGAQHLASDTSTDQLIGTQSIRTFTIGFAGADSPVLESAAAKSGGEYKVAENSAELTKALIEALDAIKGYTPTVAAPTVPLSAMNRA